MTEKDELMERIIRLLGELDSELTIAKQKYHIRYDARRQNLIRLLMTHCSAFLDNEEVGQ